MRASSNRWWPRRIAIIAVTLVPLIVVGAVLSGSYAAARGDQHPTPRLAVTNRDPLTIRGRGFEPRSGIRVTVTAQRTSVRRLRANRIGAFAVTFSTVVDRCTSWSVSATQRQRLVAVLRGPKPECPPA